MALACLLFGAAHAAQGGLEYPVKAAYLYKFAPFVQWPDAAFDGPDAPFSLCVAGTDPFGANLDQAIAGQRFGRHPVVVKRMARPDKASGCQILYVGGSKDAGEDLGRLKGAPVLTVVDAVPGADSPAVIQFVVIDNRVRFKIDEAVARQNGLVISSKLLSLAVSVRTGS